MAKKQEDVVLGGTVELLGSLKKLLVRSENLEQSSKMYLESGLHFFRHVGANNFGGLQERASAEAQRENWQTESARADSNAPAAVAAFLIFQTPNADFDDKGFTF